MNPRRDIRGALAGSRLFEQPRYRAEVEAFRRFCQLDRPAEEQAPLVLEIGFDKGFRLVAQADSTPDWRFLGLEVRKAQVEKVAARCPANAMVWRADARTVLASLVPAGRLRRIEVFFPTPWWHAGKRAKRQLFGPGFLADAARALEPGGCLWLATDVEPLWTRARALLEGWRSVPEPAAARRADGSVVLSRREWSSARDGLPVWRGAFSPTVSPEGGLNLG